MIQIFTLSPTLSTGHPLLRIPPINLSAAATSRSLENLILVLSFTPEFLVAFPNLSSLKPSFVFLITVPFLVATFDTALVVNTWYHIVFTYSGVGGASANAGINIYLNGVHRASALSDSGAYTAMDSGLTPSIFIGRSGSAPNYANGIIDEVRIYDRVLTATENNDPTDATEAGDTLTGGDIYKNYKHGLSKHS